MHVLRRGSPNYGVDERDYEARRSSWRGNSPPWNGDRAVKRKRSLSPPTDRYVRSRYEHSPHNERRYSYHDRNRAHSPERRGPPDPLNRDTVATFRQYSEWFKYMYPDEWQDDSNESPTEPSIVRKRYEEYRRGFVRKQYKNMFDYHRKFAWFTEKYDTGDRYLDMRERVRQEGWKGRIAQFIEGLEEGKFDPAVPGHEEAVRPSIPEAKEEDEIPQEETGTSKPQEEAKKSTIAEHSVAPVHPQLMIKTIPPNIGRLKLEEVLAQLSGFKYVAIGDPVQKRQFYRSAWIAFDTEDDLKKGINDLQTKRVDDFRLPVTHLSEAFTAKIRYAPPAASKPSRVEKDLEQAKKLVATLETKAAEVAAYKPIYAVGAPPNAEEPKVDGDAMDEDTKKDDVDPSRGAKAVEERVDKLASETLDTDENGNPDQTKRNSLALDIYLAYLREAFNCCYYCAVVTDHQEELVRKCIRHDRRDSSSSIQQENGDKETNGHAPESYGDERWAENLDMKLACLIDPAAVDPRDYGGTALEDERTAMAGPHVSKEDEGKWRCQVCKKLFKATEFVEKHVMNKHGELLKAQMDEWELFNNFILDPQHITPMSSVPLTQSGTAQHPPEAFGLPRDWRSPYELRYERNGREYNGRDYHQNRDRGDYGRDRRASYSRRSASPPAIQVREPIRMGFDINSSIPISDFLPSNPNLPAKPEGAMAAAASAAGPQGGALLHRMAPPPPPPGKSLDPRAGQRVSYQDLDMATGEDVALDY